MSERISRRFDAGIANGAVSRGSKVVVQQFRLLFTFQLCSQFRFDRRRINFLRAIGSLKRGKD